MKVIFNWLKNARQQKGLSQAQLSKLTDIDANTLSRYERGVVKPSIDVAKKIGKALNITIDELLNGTPEENWTLEIKLSTDLNRKDVIDMRSNNCVSNLNLTPNGAALTLSGGYSIFEDDDKFEDFIAQLREARNFVIESGRKMVEFGNGTTK